MFISLDLSSKSFSVKLAYKCYCISSSQTLLLSDFALMLPQSNKLILVCHKLQTFNFLGEVFENRHMAQAWQIRLLKFFLQNSR